MIPSAFDDSTGILSGDGSVLASLFKPLYAPLSINYGEFNQPLNPFLAETPELRNILDLGIGSDTESPFDTLRLGFDSLTGYTPDTPLIDMGSSASLLATDTASTSTPLSFTGSATQGQTETTASLTPLISPEPSESSNKNDTVALSSTPLSLTESESQGGTAAVMALAASTGTGLTAEYFDNINFTQLKMRRVDAAVDFNWQLRSPHPDMGSDTFSVRWSGKIEPLYSETYTFSVPASGGVRLRIDNQLIIDNPLNSLIPTTGQISLQAGQQYDIQLEYYEDVVNSDVRLEWQSTSQSLEVVPTSQLFPTDDQPISPLAAFQVPLVSNPTLTGTIEVVDRQTILGAVLYNEFGLYRVDDELGRIGNLLPGDIGYNSAALSAGRRVASLGRNDTEVVLEFEPGQWLAAYYKPIPLNLLSPVTTHFSFTAANLDQTDHVQEQDLGFSNFEVAFEDLILGGNQDFNDLVAQVRFVNTDPIWTTDPIEEALAGYAYTYDAEATDQEGDSLTYQLLSSPEGMTIDSATGLISWQPDEVDIGDYSIVVQVDDGRGGLNQQSYTLSVQPPPRFTVDDVTLDEGDSGTTEAVFTVRASAGTIYPMTVDYTTVEGTATAGVDYTAQSGRLTFAAGETVQTIAVPIMGDTLHEWSETFSLVLSNPDYAAIEDGEGVGTITDDDEPPTAVIDDVEITEGDDGIQDITFTVNLSTESGRPITIDYQTQDGTALAGADYEATSGTITFNPGETSQTITVSALSDTLDEPTETFTVDLLNPNNVTLADNQGLGSILDNDEPPIATISDVQIDEGDSGEVNAIFTVSLSSESGYPITIDYTTAAGTASAGDDYTSVNGTVTFEPGEVVQTISVPIKGDLLDELDEETFTVALSNPINVTLVEDEEAGTGIILDDDLPPLLSVDDITVSESDDGQDSQATFTVSLSAPSSLPITVDYTTVNGTAIAGDDYVATNGTLTFNPGETTQTIQVTILDDTIGELAEAFELQLSQPVNAVLDDAVGQATITDSDVVLQEGTDFRVGYVYNFAIPSDPSILHFTYSPTFDTTDPDAINDAFEVALVDSEGIPLTHVIAPGRDAFFNWTEEEEEAIAAGVSHDAVNRTVSLNLTGLPVGIDATVLFRLVNNDSDTTTQVQLANFVIEAAPAGTQPATDASPADVPAATANSDTIALSDVSSSVQANYHQSSFNPDTGRLYTNVSLENIGTYGLNGPLWVAIANISDPSVGVDGADGITADGLPYYDFSHLITDGTFDPTAVTDERSLIFTNPNQIQFTYDLIILSTLNQGPMIESNPDNEGIVGQAYVYDVNATDPDGDALTYDLLVAPDGMTIDAETGLIQWTPTNAALGNHFILVQVSDGRGGIDQQQFTLSVANEPSNRPPRFTSDPVIDAFINQPYAYDADATDPDGDFLSYQIIRGPDGMTIDPETGAIEWTPPSALVLGDTVLGQISTPGEIDEFTFSGVQGQRLYLDPLRYTGAIGDLAISLYSPSGETIIDSNSFNWNQYEFLILEETGTYRVVVEARDDRDYTGNYGFSLLDLALVPVAPFDQRIEGTLSPGTEDDIYRFSGTKGQKLYIDQITRNGDMGWRLYDANGQSLSSPILMSDMDLRLPEDGEYYLAIQAGSGASFTNTSSYTFEIITPDIVSAEMSLGDNTNPTPVTGVISEKGEEDIYTFEGTAGQTVVFDKLFANANSGIASHEATIYNSSGNEIFSASLRTGDEFFTLDQDGRYELRVAAPGGITGSYGFSLLDLGLAPSMNSGGIYEDTIELGYGTHMYQFSGTAGQQLSFDAQASYIGLPQWSLYNPNNQRLITKFLSTDFSVTLNDTGTYTLLIDSNRNSPLSYKFQVFASDPAASASSYNATTSSDIIFEESATDTSTHLQDEPSSQVTLAEPESSSSSDDSSPASFTTTNVSYSSTSTPVTATVTTAGEVHKYTFEASAGTLIWLDQLSSTSSNIRASLRNPDGSYEFSNQSTSNDIGVIQLDQTGLYTIETYGSTSSTTGSWQFQIQELPADIAADTFNSLELNVVMQGTLDPGLSSTIYSFQSRIGQQVLFNGMVGSSVGARFYDPNGQSIYETNSFGTSDSNLFTLTQEGLYHLIIDGNSSGTPSYAFQMLDFEISETLPLNLPRQGSLESPQAAQLYQLQGRAGQRLFFDVETADNRYLLLTVYDSNNQSLGSFNVRTTTPLELTLPQDGQYTIVVGDGGASSNTAPLDYTLQVFGYSASTTNNILIPGAGESISQEQSYLGLVPVQLSVTDGQNGQATQDFTIRLWPDPGNADPIITSTPVTRYSLEQPFYRYQVKATDLDGDDLSYRLVDAPSGAVIDQDTGELLWLPESAIAGQSYNFTVEVSDRRGGTDRQSFVLEAYQTLGTIQGAVWDDLNANGYRDTALVQGDSPNIVFAIDISGSTGGNYVDWTTTDLETAATQNMGILGNEIAAIIALSEQLIQQGRGNTAQIGVVAFDNEAQVLDLDPVTSGTQLFITPLADQDGNGISDLRQVLNTLRADGGTNFTPALTTAAGLLGGLTGDPNLIFLSDGIGSVDPDVVAALESDGVNMTAFGIGAGASLEQLSLIDPDAIRVTDPRELIDIFSGWDSRYTPEPLMENVSVYLDLNNNGQHDLNEPQQTTGPRTNIFGEVPYQFVFDNLLPGTYTLQQVVPNGYEQTAPSTPSFVDTITVDGGETFTHLFGNHLISPPPNQDPFFVTDAPTEVVELGSVLQYAARATDPDPNPLTYELTLSPKGMIVDPETGVLIWKPTANQLGTHNVMLRVSDGQGGIDLQYFQVTVAAPNTASVFTSNADNLTAQVGKPFQYRAVAKDADGDPLSYRLVNPPTGMAIDATTGVLSWAPTATGDYSVTIEADDGRGGVTQQTLDLTVIEATANTAPDITSTPRLQTPIGNPYVYAVAATDVDGDPLSYQLTTAPSGMTINAETGLIEWTPTAAQFGEQPVEVTVSDGQGGSATQSFTLLASNQASNQAPVITSTPNTVTNLDRLYQYGLTATDADGDALIWRLVDAPDGMVIDAQTGRLSWQPTAQQLGNHEVSIEVFDGSLLTGQSFTLTVNGGNTPPAIVSTPITQAAQDQAYSYQVVATDRENDPLTYRLGVHPDGMTIDAQTGQITWTPTADQVGNQTVEVVVQDTQEGMQRQTYTIVVGTQAINHAPSITSTPIFVADVNGTYTYDVDATDPDVGDSITYELLQSPTGMTIDPITGVVQWNTPVTGNHRVVVGAVDDGGLGAAQGFTLTARANQAPTIRSTPILTAVPGARYAYDVQASDPEGGVLGYALDAASLSKGIQIDARGRLSWTPTLGQIGTHSITVTVTDNLGATAQQVYDLTVSADTEAPVVRLISTLNPADVGDQVSFQVRATDNRGVTGLQLTLDGSPLTLDRNGIATVTLNQAGTASLVATAYDAAGNQGQATLNLPVIDPTDNTAPIISLAAINGDQPITTFTDIIGSVTDDNLLYYSLAIAPLGSTNFQEFYRATDTVSADLLGTLDPSLLLNDTYTVRLTAEDAGGNIVFVDQQVDITGNLKLGNFTLSFTDLEIPVSGIPISVTRTYDTLTANTRDDFGFGWRLEFRDTDLRTSLGTDQLYEEYGVRSLAFSEGERVYLTLPGGQRQGFTFQPRQVTEIDGQPLLYFSKFIYEPVFVTDDGVEVTLSVDQHYITLGDDGRFYGLQGQEYNPADDLFGGTYTLTTKEGIVYTIEGDSGDLLTAQDTNGNTLTFTESGITSDTGVAVTFGRDAQGRITTVTDPDGNVIRYGYDALGDLVSVTDREGNTTQLDYNDERSHYLDEIIDPLGRSGVRTEYGADGRMSRLIDVNGEAIELVYDTANSVQTVKDVFGYETTYVYDERGNVLTELDAVGQQIVRTYDADDNVLSETVITTESGPQGWTTTYTYDAQNNRTSETNALGETTYYTYGENSRLLSETDALGNTTTYTYDERGNMLSMTDAVGEGSEFVYATNGNLLSLDDALGNSTGFSYDNRGQVTRMTDALGTVTRYEYDFNGNRTQEIQTVTGPDGTVQELITRWTYDGENRVQTMIDAEGGLTTYEYDANGNQTAMIDALGRRTEMRYDTRGQLIETILPDETPADLSDNPRMIDLYDRGGRLRASIDQAGRVTHMTYDAVGRLVETIHPAAGETLQQLLDAIAPGETLATVDWSTLVYPDDAPAYLDDNDHVRTEYSEDGRVNASIDERGNRTEYRYDAVGRLVETIYADETPADLSDNPRMSITYDAGGRRVAETDALGHTTRYQYDDLGRVTDTIFHDGSRTQVAYDELGRRTSMTDPEGYTTTYQYDALGRLTGVLDALGQLTQYRYDELGRLIEAEDANGQVTAYEYDRLGRRIAVELPLEQRSSMTYDAVGNMVSMTDFNGEVTAYGYDAQNRLILTDYDDDADVVYTYTADGQVATITDGRGITSFDYDHQGRLLSRQDPDGPYLLSGNTIEYSYDEAGNRTSVTTPNGSVTYGYDERNRLTTVLDDDLNLTTYTYDDANNLVRTAFPNDTVETRRYDDLNRLVELKTVYVDPTTGAETVLTGFDYTLNQSGHRLAVTEADGRQVNYTYDELYRLTEENINNGERVLAYTYDSVGNRLTKDDSLAGLTTYTYDANDRLLSEVLTQAGVTVHTITYTYDDNGNLLSRTQVTDAASETTTYTWNDDDRLVAVATPDGSSVTYEYDEEGIRVSSTVDGVTTDYLVDKNRPYAQVLEELNSEQLQAFYVYGHDLIAQTRNTEQDFYQVDGLGSTRALTDETGNVTDTYDYEAFGELIESEGESENSYQFAGEQFDEAIGDYYLRDRFYDPSSGRFTRRDVYEGDFVQPLSLHKYLYTHNDPINYVDPSGFINKYTLLATLVIADILASVGGEFFNPIIVDPSSVNIPTPSPSILSGATSREVILTPSKNVIDAFTDLEAQRFLDDTMTGRIFPVRTGNRQVDGVVTRFDVGGQRFYGQSTWTKDALAKQRFEDLGFLKPTYAFANHAEGHVFLQAYESNALSGHGILYIDTMMCNFCGLNGGVKNAFLKSGLDSLEVYELYSPNTSQGLVIKNVFEK